jgi:hypothetical protein
VRVSLFYRLLTALLVIFSADALFAGSVSAPMQVSVDVIARAIVTVDSRPAAVDATQTDIARGYVDVSAPIIIQVRTNSRAGYLLEAEPLTPDFRTVELTFGNAMS